MKTARKEFYVASEVFKKPLGSAARSVFMFLSCCANRDGECFPSIRRIANECGLCRNTVIRAISELVNAGLISRQTRITGSGAGLRQTSNLYRILAARGERKPAPQPVPDDKPKPCDDGLRELLERLDISGRYYDKPAAKAVEFAISELWYSENFRFKGERVPRSRVRERLRALDTEAIDSVMALLAETASAADKPAYLKACVYNAPFGASAVTAAQIARFRKYGAYD